MHVYQIKVIYWSENDLKQREIQDCQKYKPTRPQQKEY